MNSKKINCLQFVLIALIIINITTAKAEDFKKKVPHISAQRAYQLFQMNKIFLLDVDLEKGKLRSPLLGAHYVNEKKIEKIKFKFPKNKIVGVFCN